MKFFFLSAISTFSKNLFFNKLSLIAGFACTALMNATSTLMIDLVPGQSSSVTACVRETHSMMKLGKEGAADWIAFFHYIEQFFTV